MVSACREASVTACMWGPCLQSQMVLLLLFSIIAIIIFSVMIIIFAHIIIVMVGSIVIIIFIVTVMIIVIAIFGYVYCDSKCCGEVLLHMLSSIINV